MTPEWKILSSTQITHKIIKSLSISNKKSSNQESPQKYDHQNT